MMMVMKDLTSSLETIKSPRGTDRKSPAKSCLDIYLADHEEGIVSKSGKTKEILSSCIFTNEF